MTAGWAGTCMVGRACLFVWEAVSWAGGVVGPTAVNAVVWVLDILFFLYLEVFMFVSEACGRAKPWRLKKPRFI